MPDGTQNRPPVPTAKPADEKPWASGRDPVLVTVVAALGDWSENPELAESFAERLIDYIRSDGKEAMRPATWNAS